MIETCATDQKIIEFPVERPAIRPEEDQAGYVSCLMRLLAGPEDDAA